MGGFFVLYSVRYLVVIPLGREACPDEALAVMGRLASLQDRPMAILGSLAINHLSGPVEKHSSKAGSMAVRWG